MATLNAKAACVSDWSAAPEDVRDQIAALEAFIARLSASSPWLRPGAERRLAEARAHLARLEGSEPMSEPPAAIPVEHSAIASSAQRAAGEAADAADALSTAQVRRTIEVARREAGLSVAALAERAHLSGADLSAWLAGAAAHSIEVSTLQRLAQILGLRVEVVSASPGTTVAA